jgi:putative ABC transport system permease protein
MRRERTGGMTGGWLGVVLLTARDLERRSIRFAAVIVGTAVVFTLLFLMTGLVEQFDREPRATVAAFDADGWLLRDGTSGAFTSGSTMPADTAAQVVGASAATPVVISRHTIDHDAEPLDVVLVGVPAGGVGEPALDEGVLAVGREQIVVDRAAGLDVGDRTSIGGQPVTVVGVTEERTLFAGMPLVHVDLETAQHLVYRGQPLATAVLVDGTPTAVPDGFRVLASEDIAVDSMRPLERSVSSITLVQALLWFVAAMIVGTMIYLSALERRRDVAVLTAVGASRAQMGASIALQGAITGLVAALVAAVLQRFVVPLFPLDVTVPSRALIQVPVLAVLVSLAAGGIGLRAVLKTDPALAFAGPGS